MQAYISQDENGRVREGLCIGAKARFGCVDIGGRGNRDRGVVGVKGNVLSQDSSDEEGGSESPESESESLHLDPPVASCSTAALFELGSSVQSVLALLSPCCCEYSSGECIVCSNEAMSRSSVISTLSSKSRTSSISRSMRLTSRDENMPVAAAQLLFFSDRSL